MTTQDPELSAVLGWPGGISDPALDRTRLLQMVAALRLASQQALEALEHATPTTDWSYMITALRAALAQKEEPVQEQRCRAEPRSDGDFVCDCKIGECPGRSAALAQQAEPVQEPEGLDWRYTARIGYVVKPYTAPPQRKLVPLTEEEIYHATGHCGVSKYTAINIARAIEEASWEKNK